ncbi:MAG TPA: glycosyltransferase family 39 protein [Terriglobia bacterium]
MTAGAASGVEARHPAVAAPERTRPDTPPPTQGASRFHNAWFAAAMLFVVARALPVLSNTPGRDQGTYLTIGRSLVQGRILYRDLWDNKPPGIFYIYAIIGKLFGTRMWCAAAVDLALLLLVSWCLFRFAERYLGPGGAAVAVAVHATWHVEAGYIFSAQPEFFQLPLIFGAYFLVAAGAAADPPARPVLPGMRLWQALRHVARDWRVRHLAAGALLGAAFWLKYNAFVFLPLLLVPYLDGGALGGRPPRLAFTATPRQLAERLVWVLVGFATVVAVVLGYFASHGALPAMREIQFQVLPRYAAMAAERRRLPLGQWIAVRSGFFLGAARLAATAVALVVAWARRDLARLGPLAGAAAVAYAATAVQISFHSYYFATCYPFFALMWAYLAVTLWELCRAAAQACARRSLRLAQVLVWVLFANLLYWPLPAQFNRIQMDYESLREWRAGPESFYANHPWEIPFEHMSGQLQVIHYLKTNGSPGDQIFLWGGHTLICYLSGRPCVTRFVSNLGLMSLWVPQAWRDEVARELRAQPPEWIVVARDDALPSITYVNLSSDQYLVERYPEMANLVASDYHPAADFTSFVLYRRNR